ncbi:UDP-3-O-acyl-N-acetylglucosamine deacetylase [Thermodesulfobacteriota bacterium]
MKNPVILLVDDEETIINSLEGSLEDEGFIVLTAADGMKAIEIIKSQPIDMVFLDIWLPAMDGLETLKAIKDFNSSIEVVMMTGHGTVNTAVQAVKIGAFDFLEKPFSLDNVIDIIKKIKEKQQQQQKSTSGTAKNEEPAEDEAPVTLTGEHPLILAIKDRIDDIAAAPEHVLLEGEIGTGKEIVAQLIHAASDRSTSPFVKFNAAFYSQEDLDLELFGIGKCKEQSGLKPGLLKDGAAGSLYLCAVDTMPAKIQKKLAAVLTPAKQKKNDKCIIATSISDYETALAEGVLHKELYACFAHRITMPALRKRRVDIPLLLRHFIAFFCDDYGFRQKEIDDAALETLINYDWPGNVKELKNLVEKLVISVPTKTITVHDIPISLRDEMQYNVARYYERYKTMEDAEAAWRKNYILYYLRKNERDIKKTAERINIKEKNLRKYIKEYEIVLTKEKQPEKKYQRTLKRSMVLSGRGLHSGDKTGLILTPLPPNSGIFFGDISSGETIPADIDYVVSTDYATCLQNTGAMARTIEHFLAVLHAYRITNLMIKINTEVPIMDGSSVDFCQIIEDAGIEEQDELLDEVFVDKRLTLGEVNKKNKFITIEPADKLSIHYTLHYPKPVGRQEYTFVMEDEEDFKKDIAPARTFGFLKDIEALEKKGLADGGRLNNFILIDDEKIVNTDLRFPDEFVRHKILDMMGDLYLLGRPIKGKITANMTGHSENADLVRLIREEMNL